MSGSRGLLALCSWCALLAAASALLPRASILAHGPVNSLPTVTSRHHHRRQCLTTMQAMTEEEAAADQALIARVAAEVERESGVALDQLINPSKVINLERDLVKLRATLETATGDSASELRKTIDGKEAKLATEKRAVMQDWLKQIFVGQAALSVLIAGAMVYDRVPGFEHVDLSIRVLGFWVIWLFAIPSLRARKPTNPAEKTALNIAFVASPLVSLALPAITKDPVSIYWANLAVCAASYVYGFASGGQSEEDEAKQPQWVRFIFKALDFGSGRERGARK
eukprot:TRINITY_DN8015_c0_g1_i1.p1 TRINITY_DN8015_c0_g1~~TRINITY_DN8015_c0_g1_i1.p1  ORF type:complete len:282 (+),score=96.60 TRINITY_DN8015_c0_g1_i1:87-932(+)